MFRMGRRTRLPVVMMALSLCIMGLGWYFSYRLTIRPMRLASEAKKWEETDCHIEESILGQKVYQQEGHEMKSLLYWPDIKYSYEFRGKPYTSNRYSFDVSPTTNKQAALDIVNTYLKGYDKKCYVNPDDPTQAVLRAHFKPGLLNILAFGILAAGGMGFLFGLLIFVRAALDN